MKNFDIAEHLKSEQDCLAFLQEVARSGTAEEIIHALGIVARAKGMTQIAERLGVSRTSLYKSLSEEGNPAFETIFNVAKACGLRISFES